MWNQLAISLQNGNPYLLFLLGLTFLGMVFIFERLIMLQFVYSINFTKFLTNLKKIVLAEDLDRAITLCKSVSHTSLPKISLRALEAAERDPSTVRGTIEEETVDFMPQLEARLTAIPTLATLVILTGVLGSIDSLWSAFTAINVLDTPDKQSQLTGSIANALNPTSLSLMICMVFIAGHQFLRTLAIKLSERVHHGTLVISNLLVPQEMATFVASADQGSHHSAGSGAESFAVQEPTAAAASEGEHNDSFDDAAVEDIKDEEEII
ncbi:MAG: MotA/TolQ/ExbB proton channel family protein [Oligoflexales bacterium]